MRHGSLFSGIGGFDLAAEWMGWENVFHCEWNPFGQKILKHYWPNAESFEDITKTDFTKYEGTIDLISGGFPCQPYSTAGKRKGKNDERHLWPEMLRAIREIKPRFVVGENVRGLLSWDGGLVFDEVCAELEAIGYQVSPVIIPACGVGAPHKRERIWFVAKNTGSNGRIQRKIEQKKTDIWEQRNTCAGNSDRVYLSKGFVADTSSNGYDDQSTKKNNGIWKNNKQSRTQRKCTAERFSNEWDVANTDSSVQQTFNNKKRFMGKESRTKAFGGNSPESVYTKQGWDNFPTQSPVCSGDDGIPTKLDGITFSKWRAESIKGYGNAIVPQVAYEIFKAIIKTAP